MIRIGGKAFLKRRSSAMFDTLLHALLGSSKKTPPPSRRSSAEKRQIKPRLEVLEDRLAPAAYLVTGLGDAGVGANNQGDLRYCITEANKQAQASTITFKGGLSGTISINSQLPTISQNITISGPGSSVITIKGNANANKLYDDFSIAPKVVAAIDDLTIEGGFDTSGGGIFNAGTLTIEFDVIQGNTAKQGGGGILNNSSGTLNLLNDTIQFNQADHGGGVCNSGLLQTVSSNDQTAIVANTATTDGGGIYNVGQVYFYGGEQISGNAANTTSGVGGGVYNGSVASFNMDSGSIANNDAFQGGGLANLGVSTLSQNVQVKGNSANQGGGLFLGSKSTTTFNTVTVSGNNLIGNNPKAKGVGFALGAVMKGLPAGLTDKDDPGGNPVQL
jgi:hypothetical protein